MSAPTPTATATASAETLAAAKLLLAQMGISPADLVAGTTVVPTFAEVIPQVRATLAPGTLRTYNAGLTRLEGTWPERRLDEPTKADFEEMARASRPARGSIVPRAGVPARSSTSSARRAVSTATPRTRAGSAAPTTPPAAWPCRHDALHTATRSPRPGWPRSAKPPPPAATTPNSTPCSCACTSKPPAVAAARSPCARTISTASSA
ncbi:hypothetical protein ACQPW1_09450 [Nocardia sp. CA-128927]|uniref:hypothetical protein n=1 Tax=Nocardia sp. CA-128927 TaxID=3239975 RepID=UPI003D96D40F